MPRKASRRRGDDVCFLPGAARSAAPFTGRFSIARRRRTGRHFGAGTSRRENDAASTNRPCSWKSGRSRGRVKTREAERTAAVSASGTGPHLQRLAGRTPPPPPRHPWRGGNLFPVRREEETRPDRETSVQPTGTSRDTPNDACGLLALGIARRVPTAAGRHARSNMTPALSSTGPLAGRDRFQCPASTLAGDEAETGGRSQTRRRAKVEGPPALQLASRGRRIASGRYPSR